MTAEKRRHFRYDEVCATHDDPLAQGGNRHRGHLMPPVSAILGALEKFVAQARTNGFFSMAPWVQEVWADLVTADPEFYTLLDEEFFIAAGQDAESELHADGWIALLSAGGDDRARAMGALRARHALRGKSASGVADRVAHILWHVHFGHGDPTLDPFPPVDRLRAAASPWPELATRLSGVPDRNLIALIATYRSTKPGSAKWETLARLLKRYVGIAVAPDTLKKACQRYNAKARSALNIQAPSARKSSKKDGDLHSAKGSGKRRK